MKEGAPQHHNAARAGDQYYFRRGVASTSEVSRGSWGSENVATTLIRPQTIAEAVRVNDRNIGLVSEGSHSLKGGTEGQFVQEAMLPLRDVLQGAERIVTRDELHDKTTPRHQAWKAVHERFNPPVRTEYVPVEVVAGPALPRQNTIVDFSRSNQLIRTAAD